VSTIAITVIGLFSFSSYEDFLSIMSKVILSFCSLSIPDFIALGLFIVFVCFSAIVSISIYNLAIGHKYELVSDPGKMFELYASVLSKKNRKELLRLKMGLLKNYADATVENDNSTIQKQKIFVKIVKCTAILLLISLLLKIVILLT
jgi:hypothetical protein